MPTIGREDTLVTGGLLPALERGRLPVRADGLRTLHPRPELRLGELRVLALELDAVRVAVNEVLHQDLASQLVLAALGDLEVDLQERVRVPVEHRRRPVLLEQVDVLQPVEVLARRELVQVDLLDQRPVLLVREAMPRELLGVELAPGLIAHRLTPPRTGPCRPGTWPSSS